MLIRRLAQAGCWGALGYSFYMRSKGRYGAPLLGQGWQLHQIGILRLEDHAGPFGELTQTPVTAQLRYLLGESALLACFLVNLLVQIACL